VTISAKGGAEGLRADVKRGGGLLGRVGTGGGRRIVAPGGRKRLGLHVVDSVFDDGPNDMQPHSFARLSGLSVTLAGLASP